MDNIFGLSMNWIMAVTVAIMILCLLTSVFIALRNPVIFKMALRNIPRRKAQTVLIMLGLMLSTLLIAASLTTGDTLDHSIKLASYKGLGHVDQTIAYVGDTGAKGQISTNNQPIDASIADQLRERLAGNNDVDGVIPMLTVNVPVINEARGLTEPSVTLTGLDIAHINDFGGLVDAQGHTLDLGAMPQGTVIISQDLANNTNTVVGDVITYYYENQPHQVTVGGIAEGSMLTGIDFAATQGSRDLLGIAMPIADVQQLTGLAGKARFIAISQRGGVSDSLGATDKVGEELRAALDQMPGGNQLGVNPIKQDAIKGAEMISAIFMSVFIVLGLFSAAAGILLIFLIFMMLAAERRSEMGMARAVGMKRSHLVQQFVAEGTAYDLGAALIGAMAGVLTAFIIAWSMASLIGEFVSIEPHFTMRSLIVAYAVGVTVTFLTIIFASVRSSQLNIVAAIRDIPDSDAPEARRRPRYVLWSKLPRFAGILTAILWFPLEFIWNVLLAPLKLAIWLVRLLAHAIGWGVVLAVLGALFMAWGTSRENLFLFSVGLTAVALGLSLFFGKFLPKRLVYTFFSAIMLYFWMAPEGWIDPILPKLNGNFEMFFVSGLSMVTFATIIIMWNADLLVGAMSYIGRLSTRWIPALKTAVAYPLASKGRTGMTIAMFSMVIFSLVVMTTINSNFMKLFSSDDATAGWDIAVYTNPSNPIPNLEQALAGTNVDTSRFVGVGQMETTSFQNGIIHNVNDDGSVAGDSALYPINGLNAAYLDTATPKLSHRDPAYPNDQAVWDAVKAGEKVVVVDSFAMPNSGFGGDPQSYVAPTNRLSGDHDLAPFDVAIEGNHSGQPEHFKVIGVIDTSVSTLFGFFMGEQPYRELYTAPDQTTLFVKLQNTNAKDSEEVAKQIESALVENGVQTTAILKLIEDQNAIQRGFFRLIQGFMGLGLLVGIAALGVIAFRSVVERRQQIGMLRAIGYQRNMVSLSFLLESIVIAGLGVISGTVMALILSYNLITSSFVQEGTDFKGFTVPWGTVAFFILASLLAAALMTWIPARKAASVPIAEALRYE